LLPLSHLSQQALLDFLNYLGSLVDALVLFLYKAIAAYYLVRLAIEAHGRKKDLRAPQSGD
jgi:hypothetical protein